MTCEAVEDDCSNNCWQEFDTDLEGSWPCIVNVTSLSNSDNNEHNNSPVFPTDAISSTAEQMLTLPVSEMPSKCNSDCYVVLERLPESLVQAAQTCKIFVSDKTALLKNSSQTDTAMASPTFVLLSDETVKTEPYEPSATVADEQASVSHLTTEQHSVIVKSSVHIPVTTDVATMTDSDAATSPAANTAGRRSYGTERDISVILLNSVQRPKTSASRVTDASMAQPHDVSRLVLSMLQQQNISLLQTRDNECVKQNENEQRAETEGRSRCVASDAAVLRQMLENANRAKAALEMQLKREQAKVRYWRAEVCSLKDTVKKLLSNGNNSECTCGAANSVMDC